MNICTLNSLDGRACLGYLEVMPRRAPIDFELQLLTIPVTFLDDSTADARSEGNNAAWQCKCQDPLPLIGRSYFQFDDTCFTVCPTCRRRFRVIEGRIGPRGKRAVAVREIQ